MAKFQFGELIHEDDKISARLGAGTGSSNYVSDKEVGKAVKLVGDSRYDLCAAGDAIEGFIAAYDPATVDDYSFGTVQTGGRKKVTADGFEASPGSANTIAVGDYVVAGTATAKGTALSAYAKVCKATYQPSAEIADQQEGRINDTLKVVLFPWRVVAILSGTGAVGDTLLIEKVSD